MDNNNDQPLDKNPQLPPENTTPENATPATNDTITSDNIKAPADKKKIIIIAAATILGLALIGGGSWAIYSAVSSEPEATGNGNSNDPEQNEDSDRPNGSNGSNGSSTPNENETSSNAVTIDDPSQAAKQLFTITSEMIRKTISSQPCDYLGSTLLKKDIVYRPHVSQTVNSVIYYKTILLYQETIDKYFSSVFTGQALSHFLNGRFLNVDGVLYCNGSGGMTGYDITNLAVTLISQQDGRYTFEATFNIVECCDDYVSDYTETSQFTIERVGNQWKVSEIDYGADHSFAIEGL